MNKKSLPFIYFFILLVLPASILAQDATWTTAGKTGLNFSQTGFTNWAGGGENSLATTAFFNYVIDRKSAEFDWKSEVDVAYGLLKQGEKDFRKSEDKLILFSKFGKKLSDQWNLTALAELRTQFDAGFKYEEKGGVETKTFVSRFLSPGYLSLALGFDYVPMENLSVFMTPLTGKATFVLDDQLSKAGAYGVDAGENALYEFGAYVNAKFTTDLMENVKYETKLNLFSAYDKLLYVDVNWENNLNMKINDFLSANVSTQLVYDDDITIQKDDGTFGRSVQFKEVIGVGVQFTF